MKYRRPLLYLLAGLALGELFYVSAFEWAARSGRLVRWVNRRPEKCAMAWRAAHSWFPFRVALAGLDLSVQTPRLEWRLQADRVSGWIAPAPLLARRLRVESATLSGVEFGIRRRVDSDFVGPTRAALLPPVPAFAASRLAGGSGPTNSAPPPSDNPWSFEFPRLTAEGIREVWLEQLRLTGDLRGQGGFAIRRRREAQVAESRLEIRTGSVSLAGESLAHGVTGALDFSTSAYDYREYRGLGALPFLDASTKLRGEIFAGPLLHRYLARAPWLEFDNPPAPFTAELGIRQGTFVNGSHLQTEPSVGTIRLFGFAAQGTSRLTFDVHREGATGEAEVVLREDDFELRRSAQAADTAALVAGSGLVVRARTRDLTPGGLPDDGHVQIDLGEAHLLDLAGFSDLLPASAGLALQGGKGTVQGVLEADIGAMGAMGAKGANGASGASGASAGSGGSGAGSAKGRIGATITEAALVSNGVRFLGTLQLDVPIASHDLAGRAFDLAGTRLTLTDFRRPAAAAPQGGAPGRGEKAVAQPGWWGRLEVGRATLRLSEPPTAEGDFTVHLRDSVPLVELYASRKELPNWVERLLVEPDVTATGAFTYSRPELTLRALKARFEHWGFEADLALGKDLRRGRLLLEWRKLALGVRIEGEKRTLKLAGARAWFANQRL